jgi:hypothetical protein
MGVFYPINGKRDYLSGEFKQMINTLETFMYSAVTGLISYLLPDP